MGLWDYQQTSRLEELKFTSFTNDLITLSPPAYVPLKNHTRTLNNTKPYLQTMTFFFRLKG